MSKFSKALALFFTVVISFGLAGCGGDEAFTTPGTTGGSGGTSGDLSISVALQDGAGSTTTSISPSNPGQLVVTVTYAGAAVAQQVVTATVSGGLASFDPADGSALTNASGIANIGLVAGSTAGAETATVSVTYLGLTATADISYQVLQGATTTTVLDMGSGSGTSFTADAIDLGGVTTLSAGGTATVSVSIVDTANSNALYTTPVSVTFSSTCTAAGTATMDSPVTTVNGTASSTYQANGCAGTDTITASASIGGTTYTATASLSVAAATVGSIQFISATPEVIALKGTGGSGLSETSEVIFTVYDGNGVPLSGQLVDFTLSTSVGAITLSAASATSNASGQVKTIVQAGTVATSARVNATVAATTISTQSVALVVSTGLPDQNSFDVAVETHNTSSYRHNGCMVPVTIYAADHFNNPAPDGTAIAFQTEGGYIEPACNTVNGQCTVNWISDEPRPADGRVTILATAIGEEGFADTNGNGRFDDGETFTDKPEAWRDDDESGTRDASEEFLDFNVDGNYNFADGLYNGTLCATGATTCSPSGTLIHVRSSNILIMGDENQNIGLYQGGIATSTVTLPDSKGVVTVLVTVQDDRGQRPPAGTTVVAAADGATMVGTTSYTVADSTSAGPYGTSFSLKANGTDLSGLLTITVTVPSCEGGGMFTNYAVFNINVADVTAPTVSSSTPAAGATGVATDTALSVVFSESLDKTTLSGNISFSPAVGGSITYNDATKTAYFLPSSALAAGTLYTMTIGSGITDVAGNHLNGGSNTDILFQTAP